MNSYEISISGLIRKKAQFQLKSGLALSVPTQDSTALNSGNEGEIQLTVLEL